MYSAAKTLSGVSVVCGSDSQLVGLWGERVAKWWNSTTSIWKHDWTRGLWRGGAVPDHWWSSMTFHDEINTQEGVRNTSHKVLPQYTALATTWVPIRAVPRKPGPHTSPFIQRRTCIRHSEIQYVDGNFRRRTHVRQNMRLVTKGLIC